MYQEEREMQSVWAIRLGDTCASTQYQSAQRDPRTGIVHSVVVLDSLLPDAYADDADQTAIQRMNAAARNSPRRR
jgi:hypothetical protein